MNKQVSIKIILLLSTVLLVASPSLAKDFFYYGTVHKKLAFGRIGPAVSGVDVLFSNPRTGLNMTVRSKCNGYYYVKLPRADYKISTVQSGYTVVVRDRSQSIRKESRSASTAYRNNVTATGYATTLEPMTVGVRPDRKLVDSAPVVSIQCSQDTVFVGEEFTLTLTASDVDGLKEIWWYATCSKSKALSQKHIIKCGGKTSIRHSVTLSVEKPGPVVIAADAIDVNFSVDSRKVANKTSMVYPISEVHLYVVDH